MEEICLTEEDIVRHKELFEYEMTQVVLALKDKYQNMKHSSSPVRTLGLEAKDIGKHSAFLPLDERKIASKPHDIPVIHFDIEYVPLIDVCVTSIFDEAVHHDMFVDRSVIYIAHHRASEIIRQELPNIERYVAYEPMILSGITIEQQEIPNLIEPSDYAPFTPHEMKLTILGDIPVISTHVAFEPKQLSFEIKPVMDLPNIDLPNMEVTPLIIHSVQQEECILDIDVPNANHNMTYVPLEFRGDSYNMECPIISRIPSYRPMVAPEATTIGEEIILANISSYEPLEKVDVDKMDYSVPKYNVGFIYSKKVIENNPRDISVDYLLLEEFKQPQNFYALWVDIRK